MLSRAFTEFSVKSVDDDQRIIEGVASTPSTDRMGDIVEPRGARFRKRADGSPNVPIKFQHGKDPFVGDIGVGFMLSATPTDHGIPVRIQIAKGERGRLKEVLDYVWDAIKSQLVRGLSIGFKEIETEPIRGTRGEHFKEWEWLELSAVTIPANADGSITSIKAIDAELRAASGQSSGRATPPPSGASRVVKLTKQKPEGDRSMLNIVEKIKEFEGARGTKEARMLELMEDSAKSGETLGAEQAEEYDTLEAEVKSLNEHIVRLQKAQAINVQNAKPVDQTPTFKAASETRSTIVTVEREEKLEPGIGLARFAMVMAAAEGRTGEALDLLQTHYPKHAGVEVLKSALASGRSVAKHLSTLAEFRTKTDIAAGTTTHATWASPLLAYNTFTGDFLEYLRPQTIVGKFGTGNIPSLNRIPFNVHIKGQTSGGTGYWVGQGKGKPVTKFDFNDTYHGFFKVAAISVITEELIRFSDPSAERLVRDGLAGALIEVIDDSFIDPTVAAVANVSPASITNGVVGIASTGDTADAVRADILSLWGDAITANLPLTSAVYITTPQIALSLSLMRNDLGQKEFPDINTMGGVLEGVPVIVSNYVPAGFLVLAFASEIWLSDDGTVTVDASREASIEMVDNPTNNSGTPTYSAGMVSMFQTNSVALRGERYINWSKRRSTAVRYLYAVSWGGAES